MEITEKQKKKIFEELLMDEELHEEACENWEKEHWGSVSYGVRKVVKILGLYDEYETYKKHEFEQRSL